MKRIWIYLSFVVMISAAVGGEALKPTILMAESSPRTPLKAFFPEQIGDWKLDARSENIKLPPDVAAQIAELYTEVEAKTYLNAAGKRMMITVAYGKDQSDGLKVHRPEVCYSAQGFEVGSPIDHYVLLNDREMPVKRVPTHMGSRFEPVTYWMVIGDKAVNSPLSHKIEQIKYAFKDSIADGLLVRVSSIAPNTEESFVQQELFIKDWMRAMPSDQVNRIFGAR